MEVSDISDEMLTAFLDGEADPETAKIIADLMATDPAMAARLDALKIPLPAMRQAFDQVTAAAPSAKLDALLERRSPDHVQNDRRPWLRKGLQLAAVASVLAFAVGLTAGRMTLPPDSSEGWRVAVAEYQALYSEDTMGAIDLAPEIAERAIQPIAAKVGAPILPETLASLDRLTFKRAQILRWEKAPLAQFAFVDDRGEPFALCVTSSPGPDQSIESPYPAKAA